MAIRVLAIDDEEDIRRLVRVKLQKAGYEVSTAADGEEGLQLALSERPDVIVVDVMMPRKDGYQVVAETRAALGEAAPVFIMLTARGDDRDVMRGVAEGADDYIIKPFSPRELIERIKLALIKRGRSPQEPQPETSQG